MDYKKLLSGITNGQFEALAENWYQRLNNLKVYKPKSELKNLQKIKLVLEQISRMEVISTLYIYYKIKTTPAPKKEIRYGGRNCGKTFLNSEHGTADVHEYILSEEGKFILKQPVVLPPGAKINGDNISI